MTFVRLFGYQSALVVFHHVWIELFQSRLLGFLMTPNFFNIFIFLVHIQFEEFGVIFCGLIKFAPCWEDPLFFFIVILILRIPRAHFTNETDSIDSQISNYCGIEKVAKIWSSWLGIKPIVIILSLFHSSSSKPLFLFRFGL